MTRTKRPSHADRLREFGRYEKDQAFLRRFESAINRLVQDRVGDRDVLWQFRSAIRRTGAPREDLVPRFRIYRGGFRSHKEYQTAALYALLQGIVWNWWVYQDGRMGIYITKERERCCKRARAGVMRLWGVIKKGGTVAGDVKDGYYIRSK